MSKLGVGNLRIILHLAIFGLATLIATSASGQNATNSDELRVPDDWSHHHLIFSEPATPEEALEIRKEPRYWHQYYRRNVAKFESRQGKNGRDERDEGEDSDESRGDRNERDEGKGNNAPAASLHRDWSMNMGSGATAGERTYPAKFSFDINSANCGNAATPDFVVFNTGLVSSASQAGIVAYDNLYSGCGGTVPSVYWAYSILNSDGSNDPITTSVVLSGDGSQVAFVQNHFGAQANVVLLKWKANDGSVSSDSSAACQMRKRSCGTSRKTRG